MNSSNKGNFESSTSSANKQTPQVPYTTFDIEHPMTTEQIKEFKQKKDKEDEGIVYEIHGKVKQIKEGAKGIKNELERQEPLLSNLNNDMDRVESKMQKSNNMLAKYLEKSSDSCLHWTIGIEFALLFLIFML